MPHTRARARRAAQAAANDALLLLPQDVLLAVLSLATAGGSDVATLKALRLTCRSGVLAGVAATLAAGRRLRFALSATNRAALQAALRRLPGTAALELRSGTDSLLTLPAALGRALAAAAHLTRLDLLRNGSGGGDYLALPRRGVALPRLRALRVDWDVGQGWCGTCCELHEDLAAIASCAPALEQLCCPSLSLHAHDGGGDGGGVVLPALTHLGCRRAMVRADSDAGTAERFVAMFPGLEVLWELPRLYRSDGLRVPPGALLARLARLRALRMLAPADFSAASLAPLTGLTALAVHVDVPGYVDLWDLAPVHLVPDGGLPLLDGAPGTQQSVAALRALKRLQLTFMLTEGTEVVQALLANLAALPALQSLALPRQLLCRGCWPGLNAPASLAALSVSRLAFMPVDDDWHDFSIGITAMRQAAADAAARRPGGVAPTVEADADADRWWSSEPPSRGQADADGGDWGVFGPAWGARW